MKSGEDGELCPYRNLMRCFSMRNGSHGLLSIILNLYQGWINPCILMPETSKLVMVFAAIVVIIAAVVSMYP